MLTLAGLDFPLRVTKKFEGDTIHAASMCDLNQELKDFLLSFTTLGRSNKKQAQLPKLNIIILQRTPSVRQ